MSDEQAHAHTGPECRVCPICQGLALLREARPEVFEHLSDALTSVLAAFAELVPTGTPATADAAATATAGAPRDPGFEQIVVVDDDERGTA